MASAKDFSVEQKLVAVTRLQKVVSKLDELEVMKGELPMEVKDLEDELEGLNNRRIKIEEEVNGITEFIEKKKVDIKDGELLLAKYEKQSDNVKNSREFEAITKEQEMQQLEIQLYQKHIKDAMREIGEKSEKLDKVQSQIDSKEANLKEKQTELSVIINESEKEEIELSKNVDATRAGVDERIIISFDRIRKNYRNGLAVVSVDRDACGGCFHSVPPQRQSEIKLHKKIIVCENCGRILIDQDLFDKVELK